MEPESVERCIDIIEKTFAGDEESLREKLDQVILNDYSNPKDVYDAIISRTQGSKAFQYFLSAMLS